ncbi:MAG: aldehyde dehydrogenase family protein, partial [Polyangiaceae bacterium]
VPLAGADEVNRTLDASQAAAKAFRSSRIADRKALCERATAAMEKNADAIARDISKMMGKPVAQAKGEVGGMAGRARHMIAIAEEALADTVLEPKENFERRIARDPLGVVLDLPAWNYPLLTAVNAVIPAVLAGNSVIVKHSPRSPLCGKHFADAFTEAGAPKGLVLPLDCDHPTSEKMVADPRVDHVVFTGSVFGGHRIAQAAAGKFMHVGYELGGNDPAYVAADCDLEKTVENVVDGAIYNAGQSCCAVERVYVHESVYDKFVGACEPLVRAYVMGDPEDAKTSLGPIAQPNHPAELEDMTKDATAKGGKLVAGGKRAKANGKGRFFEATLIADCNHEMALFQRESFGPIVAVMKVKSDDEALAKMNDSSLGLTASIWTKDRDRADRLARALDYGTVYMNRCDALDPALPWTGVKDSGRGSSLSKLGFDALTRPKALHYRLKV